MQLNLVSWKGWLWIGVGAILIVGALWILGRHSHRTTYHRPPWMWMDWISMGISGLLLALCLLPLPGWSQESLNYNPYPKLTMPPFEAVIGVAMMGLIVPGLFVLYNTAGERMQ